MNKVFVENEFAPLRRVVLTQSEFIFPTRGGEKDFLSEESKAKYANVAGKNYSEAFPDEQVRWEQERENLKTVLEKYGAEVLRPRVLTEFEKQLGGDDGCCNFFIRDPFFTVGDMLIEGSLRFAHRRNELLPARGLLEKEAYSSDAMYVAVPKPDISLGYDAEAGPFLEGGDVLVLNKTIFVGNSGLASNANGYRWLHSLLKRFGYRVIAVPLLPNVLHLDCAISLVREGLMIVCEEALQAGIPKELEKWDKIEVQFKDIAVLAVNGLPISEKVYVTDPLFENIGRQLEQRGITVEYIDFTISRSLGGSFRCSTQPLLRQY